MDQPRVWGLSRYATLLIVLVLHGAFLAALLMAYRPRNISLSANPAVELLFLPPSNIAKIRFDRFPSKRLSGDTAMPMVPPVLDSTSSSMSPPAAGSAGNGSGIDWAAEAHRALQAFEIRKHEPTRNSTVSGSPAEDTWWPRGPHHAGEQFKTASGDWIVWINANCYQVASSAAIPSALGAMLPETICPGEPKTPRR